MPSFDAGAFRVREVQDETPPARPTPFWDNSKAVHLDVTHLWVYRTQYPPPALLMQDVFIYHLGVS